MNNVNMDDTIASDEEKYNAGVWRGIADEEEEVLLRISLEGFRNADKLRLKRDKKNKKGHYAPFSKLINLFHCRCVALKFMR